MKNTSNMQWHGCPVRYMGGLLGDKWCLLLIRDLMFKGRRYFGDFLDDDEAISTNILTDRLVRLTAAGIIDKTRDLNDGKKYVYTLTEKGRDLLPVMMAMFKWSQKYDENTMVSDEYIERMNKHPQQYKNAVFKELKQIDEEALRYRGED